MMISSESRGMSAGCGVLLAHPELVEQHPLGEAVLVVPNAGGNQMEIGVRGQRDSRCLVGCGLVGLRPKRGSVGGVAGFGG